MSRYPIRGRGGYSGRGDYQGRDDYPGRGDYQERGYYQGRGGYAPRGRGGHRGDRGRPSSIRFDSNPIPCETYPATEIAPLWKHEDLPTAPDQQDDVKRLMPTKEPGTMAERSLSVATNHWLINIRLPEQLFRYEATISAEKVKDDKKPPPPKVPRGQGDNPSPEGPRINKDILKNVMQTLNRRLYRDWTAAASTPTIGIITDFSRIIITTQKLEPTLPLQYQIPHSDLPGEDDSPRIYRVTLSEAAFTVDLIRVQLLIDLIRGGRRIADCPELIEIKQVYNILMKNLGNSSYIPVGRSGLLRKELTPTEDNYLGQGMMNWTGASLVCTLGTSWKPFINVDVQNSAFLIGQKVLDAMAEILTRERYPNAEYRFSTQDANKARDVVSWQRADYDGIISILKASKIRRVVQGRKMDSKMDGICGFGTDSRNPKLAKDIRFDYNGRSISVSDYFKNILRSPLKCPNAPVLKFGKACVPAEFCTIKEGQNINRLLSGNPQRKMLAFCTEKPAPKAASIVRTVNDLNLLDPKHELLTQFGVSLPSHEMHKLPNTRILAPPELCYGISSSAQETGRGIVTPSNGAWDMWNSNLQFYLPKDISSWAIVGVGLRNGLNSQNVSRFTQMIICEGRARGMRFPESPLVFDILLNRNDDHNARVDKISREFSHVKSSFSDPKASLIVAIIPVKPTDVYGQVKQAAERENRADVLTQCVSDKNLDKGDRSTVRNILLKINTKLGGKNHVPLYPEPAMGNVSILRVPTLIIGIDVNHPSLPISGRPTGFPSFASVTGSLDRTGMPYMMHVQAQIRQANRAIGSAEVVENLDEIIGGMLKQFKTSTQCAQAPNGVIPQRIIVFRDGVGDTQFPEVLQKEMMGIRKACVNISDTYKPPITFIAVQKRHKVRFFVDENMGRIGVENVPPGTVVDKDIVSKADFYLLSHKGMLGTSRPTHYHILWDDSDFTSDEIQTLSYFLCYNYSRCNRSVSYPTPTYYSHWAALRAKELANGYADWNGDDPEALAASIQRLNSNLKRSNIKTDFPMHFI